MHIQKARQLLVLFCFACCMSITSLAVADAEEFIFPLIKSCSEGDEEACAEIDKMGKKHKARIKSLIAQADSFQADAPFLGIEKVKIPNLRKAYPIILHRYMNSDALDPVHGSQGVSEKIMNSCGEEFHNLFFLHGKEIPLLESEYPDWGSIYLMTIEHYFQNCSGRKTGNQPS